MADATLDYSSSPPPGTMRRDVISAYAASAARITAWAVVSAIIYRQLGKEAFATVAFVRGTIGILNYAAVGMAPAMVRLLAEARARRTVDSAFTEIDPISKIYVNGIAAASLTLLGGCVLLGGYCWWTKNSLALASLAGGQEEFIALFGLAVLLKLFSDASSAVLQSTDAIALDNVFLCISELLWMSLSIGVIYSTHRRDVTLFDAVAIPLVIAAFALGLLRALAVRKILPIQKSRSQYIDKSILKRLLSAGLLITAAQLADYLYAPTDYLLIGNLLNSIQVAVYNPAVQIDAGLLVLVTGLAAVLLPKAAIAHTGGDLTTLRKYYLRGTIISALTLLVAAVAVSLASPLIFRLWFNDPLPATQAILPLILIHTVIGGSSAVGRSILLGMGKVKPFTIAVLIAGISNVILSFVFVQYLHLGLRGIVLGTIVAVVGRCAIWMPWYVMRSLR